MSSRVDWEFVDEFNEVEEREGGNIIKYNNVRTIKYQIEGVKIVIKDEVVALVIH